MLFYIIIDIVHFNHLNFENKYKMEYYKRLINRNFILLLLADIGLVAISFYLSIIFRFDFRVSSEIRSFISLQNIFLLLFVKIFCFRLFSLYRGMWRYTSVWDMLNIIKANSLSSFSGSTNS